MNPSHKRALVGLFFLFGFGVMSWFPRFPEVKANLGVSNGQFGTLISLGALGSLLSLLTAGQLVQRFGAYRILVGSSAIMYSGLIMVVHSRHSWLFLISNLLIGFGLSGFHISLNGQALHVQELTKQNLMPRLHGVWSSGALSTAVISGLLAGRVSLELHITLLAIFNFTAGLYFLHILKPTLLVANGKKSLDIPVRSFFIKSRVDWLMGLALTCAVMLEAAVGDWAAIFSKEELNMSPGAAAIPYICLTSAMILGRLNVHRILEHTSLAPLIKKSVLLGGGIFIFSIIAGVQVNKSFPNLGFVIFVIGTTCAGFGSSFLAPTIFSAANKSSGFPGAVVIAQLGVQYMVALFFVKFGLAWTAQFASVGVALLLPAVMLISLYFMADHLERAGV